ncbi:MAG: sugar phosphate nucleotidyltransferase [Eubacteriales bacterium]|nr:sugar phosphate nucleotidyltransferase [Eubacteriales bacterium]
MAGGFGSRLAPMTNSRPKPLLPVFNRSVFERILDLLAENGFNCAAVTTMYLPEQIEAIKHSRINLSFFRESEPKGSAGAVRALAELLDEPVLIISGDAVCEFDLKKQIENHKQKKRQATILLTKTKKPQEFGTVLVDKSTNRIMRFMEKPSWTDTVSNQINTGVYILGKSVIEMIPDNVFFDFGRDLFPLMMKKGVPIYGEEAEGFWCDIGSFGDFYDCNMRFSDNKSIFGIDCTISENAKIESSILFEGVSVGSSVINNSILCEGVSVGDGCVIPDGCVIAANCKIGDSAVLSAGVRIAHNIKIGKGTRIMGNVFLSSARHLFGDEGINGIYGSEIDGELCFKLGQGLTSFGKPAKIGVMNDGSETADLLSDTIKVGVRSAGGILHDFENGFNELAAFAAYEYSLDCCVFVAADSSGRENGISIKMYEKNGVGLCREKQRKAESSMRERMSAPKTIFAPRTLEGEERAKFRYCKYLQEMTGPLGGVSVSVFGKNEQSNFFKSNAEVLGAEVSLVDDLKKADGDAFVFNSESLSALTSEYLDLDFWQLFMLAAQSGGRKDLYLPQSTPEFVENYLSSEGINLFFYNDSESEERIRAFETHFYTDKILLALLVCRFLHENTIMLDEARQFLPQYYLKSVVVDIEDDDRADTIGTLAAECEDCSRGVRLRDDKGSYSVFPRAEGGFRVFAEALSSELAEELCDIAEKKIKGEK